jgi:hypothetical protein
VDTEERSIEETLEDRCEVCGTALSEAEILAARESGGPFVCSVHAAEELPVEPEPDVATPPDEP